MHSLSAIFPYFLLFVSALFIKPWKKEISSTNLLLLIFIDSFSLAKLFNLNFYKIFAIFRIKYFIKADNKTKQITVFLLCFTFLSGLIFITLNPETKDPLSSAVLNFPFIRILRQLFTLLTTFIIGYEVFLKLKSEPIDKFAKPFILIGLIISVGIFIEILFKIDLYAFFTGGRQLLYGIDYDRARGFSYEPRGAAQVLSFCLITLVLFTKFKKCFFYIIFFSLALLFTKSFSGFIVLSVLYFITLLRSIILKDILILKKTLFAISTFALFFFVFLHLEMLQSNIKERSYVFNNNSISNNYNNSISNNYLDNFINRFEVFDAAYLNFLKNEPVYLPIGTGGGMGGFASQKYILKKDLYIFPSGTSSLPLMGFVYLISQFGIIIALIFFLFLIKLLSQFKNINSFYFSLIIIFFLFQYYYMLSLVISIIFLNQKNIKPRIS